MSSPGMRTLLFSMTMSGIVAPGWILALDPRESLTEGLAATLFDLRENGIRRKNPATAYSVFLREETADGWIEVPTAETRLVPHTWSYWNGNFPSATPQLCPRRRVTPLRFPVITDRAASHAP